MFRLYQCLSTCSAFLPFKSHSHPKYNSICLMIELKNAVYRCSRFELYHGALLFCTNVLINSVNWMEGYTHQTGLISK